MLVRLQRCRTLGEATLLRTSLEAAGVPAQLRGEQRGGILGEIPIPDAMVEVLVDAADEPAARGVLVALERAAERAPWRCAGCGEETPGGFELCWSCGRDAVTA